MSRIDAHHHLWRTDQGYTWLDEPSLAPIRRDFTPADLSAELAANGIDRTVLVEGGRCDPGEAAILLAHALATPQIAGVVAWADPSDPALARTIAGYRGLPGGHLLVGIRSQVQGETDPGYLDRPAVRAGLAVIGSHGLAFDLVIQADQLPAAARCARALPAVRFVLDHLGKPPIRGSGFTSWAAGLVDLAACPNVTAKLSGLTTEADWGSWSVDELRPYVSKAFEVFGVDRLMFGSDWPVCTLAGGYRAWVAALRSMVPDEARDAVFGGVAARAYHLGLE
ncbi:amidohydrolase family protein [Paractinoplanes durhamensis]|uniref:Amidohydrolase n=1 Tax=Paractinoplanes durhamensis TaxID=113563 RepID=A0ABQ3ZBD1_9ACTN|nr:amidohydrolase family protein [Actinoplanes durhamensis]GIE07125.1 amidohydrolase [Actinoplanes durhamensis]